VRVGLGLGALTALLLVRTACLGPEPFDAGAAPAIPEVDPKDAAERLGRAVAIASVSSNEPAMLALHRQLEADFPRVHHELAPERVNEGALIFRWPGTDPNAEPVLLIAHLDVVPVEPGTESDWTHPPFSGAIAKGFIWGRGTIDDKTGTVGLLHAAELLLAQGFRPRRTLVLALGHDEEIGGRLGAKALAALFEERGEHFLFVLDEGGAIVEDAIPGLDVPAAMVGVAEKGFATLVLSLQAEGGHASMPPPTGAIGRLAQTVQRLEDEPMPKEIRGATELMLDHLAPHMDFGPRIGLANRWLFGPLIEAAMTTEPPSHASIRTTLVPTMFDAGVAPNVLASTAEVVFNSRILPGDTVDDVFDHVREVVDDPQIEIRCIADDQCWDPSAVSDVEGEGFSIVRRAIAHVFPEAVVVPNLVVGATDARHYARVATDAYRFLPIRMGLEDVVRIHGTNERISVEGFADAVRFYAAVMMLAGQ